MEINYENYENFEKFMDKYGDVEVKFLGYYQFSFTFGATLDSGNKIKIFCYIGKISNEIYKLYTNPGRTKKIKFFYPYSGRVEDRAGKIIESVSKY